MLFLAPQGRLQARQGIWVLGAVLLCLAHPAAAQEKRRFPALDPATVPGVQATVGTPDAPAPLVSLPQEPLSTDQDAAVDFQANEVSYDRTLQLVSASGDVQMVQEGQTLRADRVTYDMPQDKVRAEGNVILTTPVGDVHNADSVELTDAMRSGMIKGMLSRLTDGSRFTASEGQRIAGDKTTMKDATYTPCNVCETNPDPLWQLKAEKVIHDEKNKSVEYKNARMEFAGVPFFYTPVFSHPDPSVKRKSGFLRPEYGWSSDVGGYVEGAYYFGDIAPNADATLRVRPTTERGVLTQSEWRQRFERGRFNLDGGWVRSDRDEEDGRIEQDRERGHFFADGLFNLSDTWRAGFDVATVSDKSYLRLYDVSNEDILENTLYVERLAGRDYTNLRGLAFRDLRLGPRPDQAQIIPQLSHRMLGRPEGLLGGRWEMGLNTMYLHRPDAGEQNVQRASMDLGWERRFVADAGLVTTMRASGRVDNYEVQDNNLVPPGVDDETEDLRGNAVLNMVTSYPVQKRFDNLNWLVEPMFGAALSPNVDEKEFDIPNEDSLDIMIDTSNLFSDNRFAGIDRQEDGARINYGVKTGLYGDGGYFGSLFLGQSRRFENAAYYPNGSGLEDKNSAYVGLINLGLGEGLQADYRFQFDNDNLASQRHEFGAASTIGPLTATGRYLYVNGITGTDFTETREQAEIAAEYRFTPIWRAYGSALHDLGEEPGLRRAGLGLAYADECFSFALEGVRNLTNDAAGDSETVVTARIGFKNIGEFSGPDISLRNEQKE